MSDSVQMNHPHPERRWRRLLRSDQSESAGGASLHDGVPGPSGTPGEVGLRRPVSRQHRSRRVRSPRISSPPHGFLCAQEQQLGVGLPAIDRSWHIRRRRFLLQSQRPGHLLGSKTLRRARHQTSATGRKLLRVNPGQQRGLPIQRLFPESNASRESKT